MGGTIRRQKDHAARIFFVALALTLGGAAFIIAQLEAFFGYGGFRGLLIVAGATPLGLGIYIFYEDFWMARGRLTDAPDRDPIRR